LSAIRNQTITCLLAALTLSLLGPVTSASASGDNPQIISISDIPGVVAPIAGATPVESITPTAQYTGTIAWSDLNGPLAGNFQPSTIYKATITLSAKTGYTFNSLAQNFFSVAGATNEIFNYETDMVGVVTVIFNPVFTDGSEKLDRSFASNGIYKISDVFGDTPLTESNTAVGRVQVDRTVVDTQGRIIILGSFYSDSANRLDIGSGYRNSLAIAAQVGNESTTSAALAALSYGGGGESDWYLPSIDELGVLFGESATVGGLANEAWSSTEESISYARIHISGGPEETAVAEKSELRSVRPIRAGSLTGPEIGDIGPGGGIIFYETTTAFSCGPTLTATCNYLEAAPSDWHGDQGDPHISWSTGGNRVAQVSIDHHILFRLNEDGSHDNTFGDSARTLRKNNSDVPKQYVLITTTGFSYSEKVEIEIDKSDRILVMLSGSIPGSYSGNFHNFLARYDTNGMRDSNFGSDGAIGTFFAQNGPADSLFIDFSIDSSDRPITASVNPFSPMEIIVQRFSSNGFLDSSFGTSETGTSIVSIGYPDNFAPSPSKNIQIISDDANGYLIAFTGFACPTDSDNQDCSTDVFSQLLRLGEAGALDAEFNLDADFPESPNVIPFFAFTNLIPDGQTGFLLAGTLTQPFGLEEIFGLVVRIKTSGETDFEFAVQGSDRLLQPLTSDNCVNTAVNSSRVTSQPSNSGIFVGEYCWDDGDAPARLKLKNFSISGEYQGGFILPEISLVDYPFSINQIMATSDGKLITVTGAEPATGLWGLQSQRFGSDLTWSEVEISRYQLFEPPAPAPAPVFVSAPSLIPYLTTLTAPKMRLIDKEVTCSAGTYNAGYTLGGANQGSSISLFTPSGFTFKILFDGVAQESLTVVSESTTASWKVPTAPMGTLISCSITVSVNGVTNLDKSTDNNAGVVAAMDARESAKNKAEIDFPESLKASAKAYEKSLSDNRLIWQSNIEKQRRDYQARLAKIRSSLATKATRASASRALSNFNATRAKILANYIARNQAALASKELADRQALLSRDAAIAKATVTYSAFIESIGYGILIS
jgi:hypothetical protein